MLVCHNICGLKNRICIFFLICVICVSYLWTLKQNNSVFLVVLRWTYVCIQQRSDIPKKSHSGKKNMGKKSTCVVMFSTEAVSQPQQNISPIAPCSSHG